jgi:PAS domain S-box-containing protein
MEDDPATARLVQQRLEREGYTVDLAADGATGLDLCLHTSYSLVLVDQHMPDRTGLEMLRTLRAYNALLPVVLLFRAGQERLAVDALRLGASNYLIKDTQQTYLDLLPFVVQRALEQHQLTTEKEQAEEDLSTSQALLQAVIDHSPTVIYVKDTAGRYTVVNYQHAALLQLNRDQIIGKTDYDLFPAAFAHQWHQTDQHLLATGEALRVEEVVPLHDGPHTFLNNKFPIFDEQGNVTAIAGVVTDITPQKQSEETLRRSHIILEQQIQERSTDLVQANQALTAEVAERAHAEEELRLQKTLLESQLESSPDGILFVDPQRRTRFVNQRFLEMWRMPPDFLSTASGTERLHFVLDQLVAPQAFLSRTEALYTGSDIAQHEEIHFRDGRIFERYSAPVRGPSGEDYGRVWHYRDITNMRRFEHDLRRRNDALATLNMLSDAANRSLVLSDILSRLCEVFVERFGIAAGAISLYHEHDDTLTLEVSWGLPATAETTLRRVQVATAHNRRVIYERTTLLLTNLPAEAPDLHKLLAPADMPLTAYLGVPLPAQDDIQGVFDLFNQDTNPFRTEQVEFLTLLGQQIGTAIQKTRLLEEVQTNREQLRGLSHRLVQVQEEERRAIARELHDEIGQLLTGLTLSLEMIERLPAEQVPTQIQQARTLVDDVMQRVREMSLQLRPAMLDDLGLLPTLLWHCERYTRQTGIQVLLKHSGFEQRRFAADIEIAVYRIVQEALTNVARYAGVNEVHVRLWVWPESLGVQIEDEGCGFDPATALARHQSSGLSGMHERALLLGGSLSIESQPGHGSCLAVEIPLRPPDPTDA